MSPTGGAGSMVLLVVGTLVIGTSAVLVELADTDPLVVSAYRLGYATVVLWLLASGELLLRGHRPTLRALAPTRTEGAAGMMFAVSVIFQNESIDRLGAGLATVIDNTHVVVLAVAVWVVRRRRPAAAVQVAVVLVTAGVAVVVWPGQDRVAVDAWGVTAALLTAGAYAAYIALLSSGADDRSGFRVTVLPVCRIVTTAFPVALVAALASGVDLGPPAPAHGWLLCLAVGPQVLGWTLLTLGARGVPSVTTGLVLTLQPVFTVLLAAPVLGQWPAAAQLLGATVVVLGVVVCTCGSAIDARAQVRARGDRGHEVDDLDPGSQRAARAR